MPTTHDVLTVSFLFLSMVTGCSSSPVVAHPGEPESVQVRLLQAGFGQSKEWESLGVEYVEYRRAIDEDVVIQATWCRAWTKVTVLVPRSVVDDDDRVVKAIRSGEETAALIVDDSDALAMLYAEEHRVPFNSGINRTEYKMVSGRWSIRAVRYLSSARNAGQVTLASFTLRHSAAI
ncbi:hypothetical protein [Novipirellula caenicola]|uniref:Uncharacterized protein n=1 Tax=Novipirellula caenicola TaxID=1536901 RepID=A0ABP9VY75_9BACT